MDKSCKSCGKLFRAHNSLQSICFNCVRDKVKYKSTKRKPIRRIGKVSRQWISTRHEWIKTHLPDNGTWSCYYCGRPLTLDKLTLDHRLSRSRHPELRFDLDNLVPSCIRCNALKGSLSDEEFMSGRDRYGII
jgi:5-methylcytosine-specific restriction endonuclease McrA